MEELKSRGHKVEGRFLDINEVSSIGADFDAVINCAASANVDWCEKNQEAAYRNNVLGAVNLAKICEQEGKRQIFMSTLCIFSSQDENDLKYENSFPEPVNFYSQTKMQAEKLILEISPETLIFRIRLPLSEISHPRNTIDKILSYNRLLDLRESVTVVEDAFPVMAELIEKRESGIFHLVNAGFISATEIAELFNRSFERITKRERDELLKREGRAPRPIVYAGSKRILPLPDIRQRISKLVKNYRLKNFK